LYERGGIIAAVCHGPAVFDGLLLSSGQTLVNGKRCTGFSKSGEKAMGVYDKLTKEFRVKLIQDIIESNGGIWEEIDNPQGCFTLTDGRLCTGMNPASAGELAQKAMQQLQGIGGRMEKLGQGTSTSDTSDLRTPVTFHSE